MRILELLARLQTSETYPLVDLLYRHTPDLAWGTTIIMITPRLDEDFFEGVFHANRSGLKAVLVPYGPLVGIEEARRRADYFKIPLYQIFNERDLEMWRN